jgi:hypothetical protein
VSICHLERRTERTDEVQSGAMAELHAGFCEAETLSPETLYA